MLNSMEVIARAYNRAPALDTSAMPLWREVIDLVWRQATELRARLLVIETTKQMPYTNAEAMFHAIDSGVIRISTANCDHPVWTPQENVAFRLTHDVLGHYSAARNGLVADFSWEGEVNACRDHQRHFSRGLCRRALFTEVIGQAAYALTYGEFSVQKVAFL